jgi:hypothetical protein
MHQCPMLPTQHRRQPYNTTIGATNRDGKPVTSPRRVVAVNSKPADADERPTARFIATSSDQSQPVVKHGAVDRRKRCSTKAKDVADAGGNSLVQHEVVRRTVMSTMIATAAAER